MNNTGGSQNPKNAPTGYAMPMMAIVNRPGMVFTRLTNLVVTLANLKHKQWNHGNVIFRFRG